MEKLVTLLNTLQTRGLLRSSRLVSEKRKSYIPPTRRGDQNLAWSHSYQRLHNMERENVYPCCLGSTKHRTSWQKQRSLKTVNSGNSSRKGKHKRQEEEFEDEDVQSLSSKKTKLKRKGAIVPPPVDESDIESKESSVVAASRRKAKKNSRALDDEESST